MRTDHINIDSPRLIFPNFEGRPDKYNKDGGKRVVTLELDEKTAKVLEKDGFNIRWPVSLHEDEDPKPPRLQVNVSYSGYTKPMVVMVTSGNRTLLGEHEVALLDSIIMEGRVEMCDAVIRPYNWDPDSNAKSAYLVKLFVRIEEDPYEAKYGMWDRDGHAEE